MSPWRNPRVLSTLFVVFLCGATAGALTMKLSTTSRTRHGVSLLPYGPGATATLITRCKQELSLTPEQMKNLEVALDDYAKYMQMLDAQRDGLRADGKSQIMKMLNPEQRQKFETIMLDMKK